MDEGPGHRYFLQCECCCQNTHSPESVGGGGDSLLPIEPDRDLGTAIKSQQMLVEIYQHPQNHLAFVESDHSISSDLNKANHTLNLISEWLLAPEPSLGSLSFHNLLTLRGFELASLWSGAHTTSVLMLARETSPTETSESCLQTAEWVGEGTFPHPHCASPVSLDSHFQSECCVGSRIGVDLQKVQRCDLRLASIHTNS